MKRANGLRACAQGIIADSCNYLYSPLMQAHLPACRQHRNLRHAVVRQASSGLRKKHKGHGRFAWIRLRLALAFTARYIHDSWRLIAHATLKTQVIRVLNADFFNH
ncbi:MAG TPA: hypothetical protein VKZ94_15370 [Advenella sp.]|nr:hypothetical protein [Advenella sp.]